MSIECYYHQCPLHGTHFGDEGQFCDEVQCTQTPQQIMVYQRARRLERRGYELEQLEKDSPYNFPTGDL